MKLDDFIQEVVKVTQLYSLKAKIIAKTENAVKIKVPVSVALGISIHLRILSPRILAKILAFLTSLRKFSSC